MTKTNWQDDRRLDHLVDGELSREQYAAILRELDASHDGWKQCALRFLEQQALRGELSAIRDQATVDPRAIEQSFATTDATDQPAVPRRREATDWSSRHGLTWFAIAASFLLALGINSLVQHWRIGGAGMPQFAQPLAKPSQPADDSLPPIVPPIDRSPAVASQANSRPHVAGGAPAGRMTVYVRSDEQAASTPVDLPLVGSNAEFDEHWHRELPELSPETLQALQRIGGEVHWNRELVPFEMDDGRRVLVPVDRLEIVPVNRRIR